MVVGGGGGARVSECFFTKNPNLKKNIIFFLRGGGEAGAGEVWGGGARVSEFFNEKSKSKKNIFFV